MKRGFAILRCSITKNLEDKKISYPRLRSVVNDAFHCKCAYKGPIIEECTFEFLGDDGINNGTRYHIFLISIGKSAYIILSSPSTQIEPGNTLQVIA